MRIIVTGGTGFVGPHLVSRLANDGHEVTVLIRPGEHQANSSSNVSFLQGDPTQEGSWQDAVSRCDAVINLAGASVFTRWTDETKKIILESRISTTRNIVNAITRPISLFSTSAVGYYGFHGDEELIESSPPGNDFLASVAVEWERETLRAREKEARVVITRFGIVLGPKGGALGQMIPLFRKFLGGPIGSGRQWFSWIHIRDLTDAFIFLLAHPDLVGPFNFCSPKPVRNRDLARALGRVLHRPSYLPAPAFMIRLVLGEFGSVILKGQRVIPRRLLDAGYIFQYPEIEDALRAVVGD